MKSNSTLWRQRVFRFWPTFAPNCIRLKITRPKHFSAQNFRRILQHHIHDEISGRLSRIPSRFETAALEPYAAELSAKSRDELWGNAFLRWSVDTPFRFE